MSDADHGDGHREELRSLVDKVYGDHQWLGKSCVSYVWPYTASPAMFEVRRAIANMTEGLRSTYGALELSLTLGAESPELSDILRFLKSADEISKAANEALREVVAEAIASGATWAQIGEVLGVQRTAAHKRFHDGLSDRRKEELLQEKMMSDVVVAFWTKCIPESAVGIDDEHWEAVSPEAAVDHAFRSFILSMERFRVAFAEMPDAGEVDTDSSTEDKFISDLFKAYNLIKNAFHVLVAPQVAEAIVKYTDKSADEHMWTDTNSRTYFTYAIFGVGYTFDHFNRAWDAYKLGDSATFTRHLLYVHDRINGVVRCMSRPEFINVLAEMEAEMQKAGDSVMVASHEGEPGDFDQAEALWAYWKRDKKRLAELLDVEHVNDAPTLDELFKLME